MASGTLVAWPEKGAPWPNARSAPQPSASSRWARGPRLGGRPRWSSAPATAVASAALRSSRRTDVAYTRARVREAVERAGDEHWQALIRHHEDAYPASRPTPGDVCGAEAERLNELGLGDVEELALVETRVERTDSTLRVVHLFQYGPHKARLLTEPFEGYGGGDGEESQT